MVQKVPFVHRRIFSSDFVFKEMKVKMSRYPLFLLSAISYSSIIDHYIFIVKLKHLSDMEYCTRIYCVRFHSQLVKNRDI